MDSFGYVCIISRHSKNRLLDIHGVFFSHFQAIPKPKTWLDVTKELTVSLQTCFSHGGTAVQSVFSRISEEGPLPASPLLGLSVLAIPELYSVDVTKGMGRDCRERFK